MTKYARIVDGRAVDVVDTDPAELFHPEVAEQFITVPDDTSTSDHFDGEAWTKYVPPELPAVLPVPPVVTPPEFKLLILDELPEIMEAAQTDIKIAAFMEVVNDPRLTEVDLSLKSVQNGLKYCLKQIGRTDTVISERMDEILSGKWS
jgi:hypothetical protein